MKSLHLLSKFCGSSMVWEKNEFENCHLKYFVSTLWPLCQFNQLQLQSEAAQFFQTSLQSILIILFFSLTESVEVNFRNFPPLVGLY